MSLVWRYSRADGSALLTALAIADFADDDGRAYPSVPTLARKTRTSDRTVRYALSHLRELGELTIDESAGPRGCNVYRIMVDHLLRGPADSAGVAGAANSAPLQSATPTPATGCSRTIIEPSEVEEGEAHARAGKAAGSKAKRPTPPAARLDFDFEKGVFVGPVSDHFERWHRAFPAVDLVAEVARAAAWLFAHPANRKSDYLRFLTNWLNRAQDRAPRLASRNPGAPTYGNRPSVTDERADWLNRATGRTGPDAPPDEPDTIDG